MSATPEHSATLFSAIMDKLDHIDTNVTSVNRRVTNIESRLSSVEQRFDAADKLLTTGIALIKKQSEL